MNQPTRQTTGQTRHAIILAAGESTRTRPLTYHRPKPLIPLMGQPLLAHILDELVGSVERVTLVVGYRAEAIQSHFGPSYRGIDLYYVQQNQTNGTAGALMAVANAGAIGDPGEAFYLLYGDNLISQTDVIGTGQQRYCLAALRVEDPTAFGMLDIQGDRVVRIIEKPATAPPDALGNPGIYHLDGRVLPLLHHIRPSPRGEYELTDLIALLSEEAGQPVGYHVCRGFWIPVGNPWDVLAASAFLLERRASLRSEMHPHALLDGSDVNGWVHIGQSRVGKGCRIIGPAFIGDHVTIEDHSTIAHSVIESGATIGAQSVLEWSVVGERAAVGSECIIQHSLLDNDARVGEGSRLLAHLARNVTVVSHTMGLLDQDALLRRGSVVGAGVQIPPGAVVQPGSILLPHMLDRSSS